VSCVREGTRPRGDGHDRRAVVEIVHAEYASAAHGRRIELPFPDAVSRPIDHVRAAEPRHRRARLVRAGYQAAKSFSPARQSRVQNVDPPSFARAKYGATPSSVALY
jgi:hypothetical protein